MFLGDDAHSTTDFTGAEWITHNRLIGSSMCESLYMNSTCVCACSQKSFHTLTSSIYLIIFSSPPRSPIVVASLSGLGVLAMTVAVPRSLHSSRSPPSLILDIMSSSSQTDAPTTCTTAPNRRSNRRSYRLHHAPNRQCPHLATILTITPTISHGLYSDPF